MFFSDKYLQRGWTKNGFQGWNRLGDIGWHKKTICHINTSIIVKLKQNFTTILPSLEGKKREEVAMNREVVNTLVEITVSRETFSFV